MLNTKRQDKLYCQCMQINKQQLIYLFNLKIYSQIIKFNIIAAVASNAKSTPTGIDDLLPVMLYLVIQSLPARPLTNLQFISELRSDKYLLSEEYYFTLYSSVMELIDNLKWQDLKDIPEKQFNEQFKANYKKYSEFLDAVDKEEEELKKQEIFKQATALQNQMKEFQERFTSLENNKLKFSTKSYQQMSLGDLQEFYNEYHILHKHILDSQQDLQKQVGFLDNYIDNKSNNNNLQKQISDPQSNNSPQNINNNNNAQNTSKPSGFFSFF